MNGRRYRAVFSNAGGTTVSPSSTLNVIFAESPVVLQNARDNLFAMDSVTLVGSLNVSSVSLRLQETVSRWCGILEART